MLDDFAVRAALAGMGLAVAAGPLGCFVIWRRMAYFGDATAHAALLGVALGLAFNISILAGVLVVSLMMALTFQVLTDKGTSADSALGVLAHGALAFGLVGIGMLTTVRIDPMSFLVGDILAVGKVDLLVIWGGALVVLTLLISRWSALLTTTLNPDLARASGVSPKREEFVLTLALALIVAVAIQVVGALLITAMLIIPAAAARPFARSPEQMSLIAVGIGVLSALGGIVVSFAIDSPTGPTMVTVAVVLFAATTILGQFIRR
ncbi:MAG: metal ABC transporter permease [Pseudomonadota bacterium]